MTDPLAKASPEFLEKFYEGFTGRSYPEEYRMTEQKITNEDVTAAHARYVEESAGAQRGSVRESAAWDRYMAVLRKWRNQA